MTAATVDAVRLILDAVVEEVRLKLEPAIWAALIKRESEDAFDVDREEKFLRVTKAAKIADCHRKTITRLVRNGELERHMIGGDIRIRLGDLRAYLARRGDQPSDEEIRRRARAAADTK
jgi:excisionase family DNA binding protein